MICWIRILYSVSLQTLTSQRFAEMWPFLLSFLFVKGGVREKWKGIWAYGESNRFWSLLILLLSVASIRRELLKTTYSEECSVHTNSESCNLYDSNCKIINFILNKSFRYCNLWSSNIFRRIRIQLMFHNFFIRFVHWKRWNSWPPDVSVIDAALFD